MEGSGIGVSDTLAAGRFGTSNDLFGRAVLTDDFSPMRMGVLRDIKVLTMLAVEIASHGSDGKRL